MGVPWKIVGLAGVAGVAATTGVVVARKRRDHAENDPDELRDKLHSRVAEAEAVYREDLGLGGALPRAQIHPDNVWALRGLLDCLERHGDTAEAALIRQRVEIAAARADVPVAVSCFCARDRSA